MPLTANQEAKLPPALKAAILAKQKKTKPPAKPPAKPPVKSPAKKKMYN
tara:strand:+ start:2203 stop:2349 length:147 start_codon:yes stop_codon:yes gene_type:complete